LVSREGARPGPLDCPGARVRVAQEWGAKKFDERAGLILTRGSAGMLRVRKSGGGGGVRVTRAGLSRMIVGKRWKRVEGERTNDVKTHGIWRLPGNELSRRRTMAHGTWDKAGVDF
jgi:hypothetical protein